MVFSALLSKNICLILRFLFKVYLGEESRVKGPVNYHLKLKQAETGIFWSQNYLLRRSFMHTI